jgi:hypothetical protein
MQNFFALEIEAEFRRSEWQRAVEAATRAAQARPENGRIRWSHLPHLVLASLRSVSATRSRLPGFGARSRPGARASVRHQRHLRA